MQSGSDEVHSTRELKSLIYAIDVDQRIIYESISGFIQLDDLIEFKNKQADDPDFKPDFSYVTDIRQANFSYSKKRIHKAIKFFERDNIRSFTFRKSALITSKPIHVVVSRLFELNTKNPLKGRFKIFSTYEAALDWVSEG